jgi:hypothetical protein
MYVHRMSTHSLEYFDFWPHAFTKAVLDEYVRLKYDGLDQTVREVLHAEIVGRECNYHERNERCPPCV